jgi:hypothetical protein
MLASPPAQVTYPTDPVATTAPWGRMSSIGPIAVPRGRASPQRDHVTQFLPPPTHPSARCHWSPIRRRRSD